MNKIVFYFVLMCASVSLAQKSLTGDDKSVEIRAGSAMEGDDKNSMFDADRITESLAEGAELGNVSEPIPESESLLPTNKPDSGVSFLLSAGVEYTDEGEYEAAERAYLRALEKDPENPELLFRLSTVYSLAGDYEKSIELLKKQIKLTPKKAVLYNNLSWNYSTGDGVLDPEKALRHAREALLYAPYQATVWNTLAEAYYVSGDYPKALRSAEQAIDLLSKTDPPKEQVESYEGQRQKILQAMEAIKIFDELGSD